MEDKTIADELRHLLSICNGGKEGYKHAAKDAEKGELKALFTTYSLQRAEFANNLRTCIHQIGGNPDNESSGSLGVLHRTWIDIKTALTGKDNKAVLEACLMGEKAAVEAYDKVLKNRNIGTDIRQILMQQRSQISEALHHIQRLEIQEAS